jgi:Tfp pilus assembly protein PilX
MDIAGQQPAVHRSYFGIILSIVLLTLALVALAFLWMQYSRVSKQYKQQQATLQSVNAQLQTASSQLMTEKENYASLESLASEYLTAENQVCAAEVTIKECLAEKVERAKVVVGQECSPVQDDTCPQFCVAGSDYDCCVAAGKEWLQGRGCY